MATIATASAKGGAGKTTGALLISSELALMGYRVTFLDADINRHGALFGQRANIPGLTIIGDVTEANILDSMAHANAAGAEVTVIDLPGGTTTLSLMAMQCSDLVLVPSQQTLVDARDATRTLAQVDAAQQLVRRPIARALLWSRLSSGFESRAAKLVREQVEQQKVPILRTGFNERAAFAEMHLTGQVPRQYDPRGSAAANVTAVTTEVLALLAKHMEQINGS